MAEKLLLNKTVSTLEEGQQLFEEAKKYLWLVASDRGRDYPVGSLRVDEAWHQFFLFTRECRELCLRIFGCFLHHAPPTKEGPSGADVVVSRRPTVSYAELAARYRGPRAVRARCPDLDPHPRPLSPEGGGRRRSWRTGVMDGLPSALEHASGTVEDLAVLEAHGHRGLRGRHVGG
ncbi:hypothetical protein BH11MYX4_BH11MYX4_44390 [soil metagenome]